MYFKRKRILTTLAAIISIFIVSSIIIIKATINNYKKSLDPVTLININWNINLPKNTAAVNVLSDETGGFTSDGIKLTKINYTKDHLDELNNSFNFSSFDSLALDKFNFLAKSIDNKKSINEITDLIVNDNSTLKYKIIEKGSSFLLTLISTKPSDTLSLYCLEYRL
ncbi:hypothetical protein CSC2_21790 [Clostridium zeae]|uniref:Lipoprotein n=1 Tax=Clostridium zeae TaxID=2759022 RepID=A0ABQ1EAW0_9CLOT|nr:hypothetical protein [Clostridium zeae]GFZ31653.1 hypothetical protein CSC2_21790 [Clostridium zeae]